jgi:hypothetical protein
MNAKIMGRLGIKISIAKSFNGIAAEKISVLQVFSHSWLNFPQKP